MDETAAVEGGAGQAGEARPLNLGVAVVTWNRPAFVAENLAHLRDAGLAPQQVVVVDASADTATEEAVMAFAGITYVRFPQGAGHMTTARNEALRHVVGDVVAFLDDDAYVRQDWAVQLLEAFRDPSVGAVAGRTCNGDSDEDMAPAEAIGRLLGDGSLTGNFAADPGAVVAVDHGIGANMAFRREVLAALGGFRDDFPGTALREDTDIFLRVRELGHRAVFTPFAVADHVAAPHIRGKRFDWRYQFWAFHNHLFLLLRHQGLRSSTAWRWAAREVTRRAATAQLRSPRSYTRPLACVPAAALALVTLARVPAACRSVVRTDDVGRSIRECLTRARPAVETAT